MVPQLSCASLAPNAACLTRWGAFWSAGTS